MNLYPEIRYLPETALMGMHITTSLSENRTIDLWKRFKPGVKTLPFKSDDTYYSVRKYPDGFRMQQMTPFTPFEEWAAMKAASGTFLPEGWEKLIMPGGRYAVFQYRGTAADFIPVIRDLYLNKLPELGFQLDDREHFTVMGPGYAPDSPASEEEIWIPIR